MWTWASPWAPARRISQSGTSDTTTSVGGYGILQAEDMDGALALLEGHPHLMMPGASIQVYETLDLPGM
ncbi:hypothetical protein [Arthrobacter sp. NPDC056727]|uniref:hypothetical protein n=1 Tax=Arthrobacter sp. NPDC056727 TaxID=3345927 RepID=UPI00366C93CB